MHHPTGRTAHTMAFVNPVVEHQLEQEIAQWVHYYQSLLLLLFKLLLLIVFFFFFNADNVGIQNEVVLIYHK